MSSREESIGVRVNDTSIETATAKLTVNPNSKKNRPTRPVMKATGMNTATTELGWLVDNARRPKTDHAPHPDLLEAVTSSA